MPMISNYQPLLIDEKLEKLKTVLPSASDEKLAALIAREKGDMNAVVECILEEPIAKEECFYEDESPHRVIDLTDGTDDIHDDPPAPPVGTTEESMVAEIAKIDVDCDTLRSILKSVEENESKSSMTNLLSFNRPTLPECVSIPSVNEASLILSQGQNVGNLQTCPFCTAFINKTDKYCKVCGGVFDINPRW